MKKIKVSKEKKKRKKKIHVVTFKEMSKHLDSSQIQYMKRWGLDK
jgi:hypothetical protein